MKATKVSSAPTRMRLAQQRVRSLSDVAAEDGHGADAQGQREERLAHGGVHGLAEDPVAVALEHALQKSGIR